MNGTNDPVADGRGEIRLVLVDFDDTLVETAPRFRGARERLFALLEREGFARDRAHRVHHDEVDPEMIRVHGLGPFRLEPSFRETYVRLCRGADREPDPALAEACAELARGVAGTPPAIDGALPALRELAATHPTVLYTQSAHPDYQFECVRDAGVLDVLPPDRVRISERKTEEAFRAALRHYGVEDPSMAWMIGNSVRSDINPALSAGARAILVEVDQPWVFDQADPVSDRHLRADTFAEAAAHLLRTPAGGGDE